MKKKKINRIIFLFIIILIICIFLCCDNKINIKYSYVLENTGKDEYDLLVGESFDLNSVINHSENTSLVVTIDEDSKDIIEENNLIVTGIKEGTVKLQITLKENNELKIEIVIKVSMPIHTHEFNQKVIKDEYIKSTATCTSKAKYYYSCLCGETSTEVFEDGEFLDHVFDQKIIETKYLASEQTKTSPSKYYYSCKCGEIGTETFLYGDVLPKDKYSISYNLNGGICENLINEFTEDEEIILPNPTLLGSEFLGWYEDDNQITKIENRNYSLIAKWNKVKAIITVDVNHGNSLNETTFIVDFNQKIKLPKPTREGYEFMGWSNTRYGAWIDKFTHNNCNYQVEEKDETVYALWIPNEYQHYCIEDTFENNSWHHVYHVFTIEDLINLPIDGYAYLENDINFRNKTWEPLGDVYTVNTAAQGEIPVYEEVETPYKGYFDGCGYTIRNVKINSSKNNVGFFGVLDGYVYNLTITNITITSENTNNDVYLGSLFGKQRKGKIFNTNINNIIINAKAGNIGLLGGYSNGQIEKVSLQGQIDLTDFSGNCTGIISIKGVHSVNTPEFSSIISVDSEVVINLNNTNGDISGAFTQVSEGVSIKQIEVNLTINDQNNSDNCKLYGYGNIIEKVDLNDCYINITSSKDFDYGTFNTINNSEINSLLIYTDLLDENGKVKNIYGSIINSQIQKAYINTNITNEYFNFIDTISEDKIYNEIGFSSDIWVFVNDKLTIK